MTSSSISNSVVIISSSGTTITQSDTAVLHLYDGRTARLACHLSMAMFKVQLAVLEWLTGVIGCMRW